MMKNLRYVCAQPAINYYTWQVEVMINNFLRNGINPNNIDIVCATRGDVIPPVWQKLAAHYNTVRFFFYPDDREGSPYISSVRPNILKKHFAAFPEMKDEAIMYHDCDIVFTRPPVWDQFLSDDTWYCSDTRYYVGANYIKSKKCGIYERMCEIIGIDEAIPAANEEHSGGAQYIMKNVDAAFWEKVEKDCDTLYQFFLDHLKIFPQTDKYHPIQKWTADMWAVLWNAWGFGHEVRVVPELEFAWPTQGLDMYEKCQILHNAGVLGTEDKKWFYKGVYQGIPPYDIKLEDFDPAYGSYKYVEEIVNTAKVSCLV